MIFLSFQAVKCGPCIWIVRDEVKRFDAEYGIPMGVLASLACDTCGQVWLAIGGKLGRLHDDGFELVRDFAEPELGIAKAYHFWLRAVLVSPTLWTAVRDCLSVLSGRPAATLQGRFGP